MLHSGIWHNFDTFDKLTLRISSVISSKTNVLFKFTALSVHHECTNYSSASWYWNNVDTDCHYYKLSDYVQTCLNSSSRDSVQSNKVLSIHRVIMFKHVLTVYRVTRYNQTSLIHSLSDYVQTCLNCLSSDSVQSNKSYPFIEWLCSNMS